MLLHKYLHIILNTLYSSHLWPPNFFQELHYLTCHYPLLLQPLVDILNVQANELVLSYPQYAKLKPSSEHLNSVLYLKRIQKYVSQKIDLRYTTLITPKCLELQTK